jgi:mono/diheme cytochrome c family protein
MKLGTLLLIIFCTVVAHAYGAPYKIDSDSFGFDQLMTIVNQPEVRSVETLLPRLPRKFRGEYALVYKSRSLQEASFQNPRVLMYNADSSLVISFNGHPSQKGFDQLEVMSFNQKSKSFEFREINFATRTRGGALPEVNPPKCLRCHGDSPRPIWDGYPLWPGLYGSQDDHVWGGPHVNKDPGFVPSQEDREYDKFWRNRVSSERYRNLESSPRREGALYPDAPNFRLGYNLQNLMNQRNISQFFGGQKYYNYRYALLASFDCPQDSAGPHGRVPSPYRSEDFVPVSLIRNKLSVQELFESTIQMDNTNFIDRVQRQLSFAPDTPLDFKNKGQVDNLKDKDIVPYRRGEMAVAFLRAFLEPQNFSLKSWFMGSFPAMSYEYDDGATGFDALKLQYWRSLLNSHSDQHLYQIFSAREADKKDLLSARPSPEMQAEICEDLKYKSQQSLAAQPLIPGTTASPLNICIKCHASNLNGVPSLPFDDPAKLSQLLNQPNPHGSGTFRDEILRRVNSQGPDHMPPFTTLQPEELKGVESYVNRLSGTR